MASPRVIPPRPAELEEALQHKSEAYTCNETSAYCRNLWLVGEKHDPPWHWGYRVYRTTYSGPNSDADFENAMHVIKEYVRFDISSDPKKQKAGDVAVQEQLWKRFNLDVVQDPELEGASVERIHELAKEHVHSQGRKVYGAACCRFFLMIDCEVVRSLLTHTIPAKVPSYTYPEYGVKLLDAQYGLPHGYWPGSGNADDSEDSDDSYDADEDLDHPDEGWCWISPYDLLDQWCHDGTTYGSEEMWSVDRHCQPIHRTIMMSQIGQHDPAGNVECSCGGRRWE